MDATKFVEFQKNMKENQSDLQDYLQDLTKWTKDVKQKESDLKPKSGENGGEELPPVRNSLLKKKKIKKVKTDDKKEEKKKEDKKQRLSGYDYRAWDKFDVDKALAEAEEAKEEVSSEGDLTDEEWEDERRRKLAEDEKQKGNQRFKEGLYIDAIEHYTTALRFEPKSAIIYSNRAMCQLKREECYSAAEVDCDNAIAIDPYYTKAYYRRGLARSALGNLEGALEDFNKTLQLDPHNKAAEAEHKKLDQLVNPSGIVRPVTKAPNMRSMKPLVRIDIQEVGDPIMTSKKQPDQLLRDMTISSSPSVGEERTNEIQAAGSQKVTSKALMTEMPSPTLPVTPAVSKKPSVDKPNDGSGDGRTAVQTPKATLNSPRSGGSSTDGDNIPPVPTSSYQFQKDAKEMLKRGSISLTRWSTYFCAIAPENYHTVFGQSLESDSLFWSLCALKEGRCRNDISAATTMQCLLKLATVPRFSMTWLFLTQKERAPAVELIGLLERDCDLTASTDLVHLKSVYA